MDKHGSQVNHLFCLRVLSAGNINSFKGKKIRENAQKQDQKTQTHAVSFIEKARDKSGMNI